MAEEEGREDLEEKEVGEEEKRAWKFLEVVHFCAANARFGAEEKNASQRGGIESRRAREISHQDH